jgi:hypothetical protein
MNQDPVAEVVRDGGEIALPPAHDMVGDLHSSRLVGCTIRYRYTTGRCYELVFEPEVATFRMLDAPGYVEAWGQRVAVRYRSVDVREDLVIVHWMGPPQGGGHVTMVIDLAARKLFASALMPFAHVELFDAADIDFVDPA